MQLCILPDIKIESEQRCDDLPDTGGDRGAGHAHRRHAEKTEDHDRIQDDIDDRAGHLADHAVHRLTGRLEKPLEHHLIHDPGGNTGDDAQICRRHLRDFHIVRLCSDKGSRKEEPDHKEQDKITEGKEDRRVRGLIGAVEPLLSQRL